MRNDVLNPMMRQELIEVLERYFAAVASQKGENPADLMAIFAEVDAAEVRYAEVMPPRLRHFFEGKSYRKAHEFLRGMGGME